MCIIRVQFLISIIVIVGFLAIIKCSTGERSNSVGVIDLRPKLSPDKIYQIGNSCVGKAVFPTTTEQSEDDDSDPIQHDESSFDDQAAAAHCVGAECATVYFIVSYDFANSKTVLHGAFGGTKLMSFVDGTRTSWKKRQAKTKLIMILVPSSESSENQLQSFLSPLCTTTADTEIETEMYDLTNVINDNTMLNGAKILLERLRSCFEYGGEEFQDVDIFQDAEIVCMGRHCLEQSDDGRVDNMILTHQVEGYSQHISTKGEEFDDFKELIASSYKSASGSGDVKFI